MSESHHVPGKKAALFGFFEGAAYCLLVFGVIRFVNVGSQAFGEWRMLLALAIFGGGIFAIARGIGGGLAGGLIGGILGVLVGGALSVFLPVWTIPYVIEEKAEVGQEFRLEGPGLDGKMIRVSDYRGKVLLVDFWATWCGPCLHELPNVLDAYDKYHPNGFDILGVSLDHDREDLEAFIKNRKLPWKQIFFDEPGKTGWQNPLAKQHGVRGIPATFLLDREGKVAATDLRGDELTKEVGRLLGETDEPAATPGMRKRIVQLRITHFIGMLAGAIVLAILGALFQRSVMPRKAGAS